MTEPLDGFLTAVDGALWVLVDRQRRRFFVWKGGAVVVVLSTETAESLDEWPCDGTLVSAARVVAERTNQGY